LPPRKIAFVTAATDHGTLIVNRFDCHRVGNAAYGVGFEVLEQSAREPAELNIIFQLLDLRRHYAGDGVVAVDCGANIGIHTIEMARHMTNWGEVLAIEAQERVYYALAGNIAVNNCFNARALCAAVGRELGMIKIPSVDYRAPASFGSLELRKRAQTEFIGQPIDYDGKNMVDVRLVTIDSLKLARIDLLKIDVEGMEGEVLEGAANAIGAHKPVLWVEWIKCDKSNLRSRLEQLGYSVNEQGMNLIAVHRTDKCLGHIQP
jgi:FkbM family methyltransferase